MPLTKVYDSKAKCTHCNTTQKTNPKTTAKLFIEDYVREHNLSPGKSRYQDILQAVVRLMLHDDLIDNSFNISYNVITSLFIISSKIIDFVRLNSSMAS